jgi:hypothetical protein
MTFLLRPGGTERFRSGIFNGERFAGRQLAAIPPQYLDLPCDPSREKAMPSAHGPIGAVATFSR